MSQPRAEACRRCGRWRSCCEVCAPTSLDAALRVAEATAVHGEPVPTSAANVMLARLDELHERRPGVMVLLMLHEHPPPADRPRRAP